ncbi:MAG TPA: hypothetical protein VNO70_06220, partial [Blastocatellia bacterium]|nr:hypothetical protein [Blastocatellia bacterium]
ATGQGPVFAEGISEIGKVATTVYNLSSVNGNVASINGDIALQQSGAAQVLSSEGEINVNVVGTGAGRTRFEYDTAESRIIRGETEIRFEGRLANIPPADEGEKLQPRKGSVVETAKYSIRLAQ